MYNFREESSNDMTPATSEQKIVELPVLSRGARAGALRTLRQWIEDGTLAHGQPLPAERELASHLKVNRTTLRAALLTLNEEGLLRSDGGRSRIVHSPKDQDGGALEHTIAVLAPDEGKLTSLHQGSGWAEQITQGALARLKTEGLHTLVLNPDRIEERDMARILASQPFGVIITEVFFDQEHLKKILNWLESACVPCTIFGEGPAFAAHDRVVSDHEAGAYAATRWLLDQGRTRILPLWPAPANSYWLAARRAGYERALEERSLEPLSSVVAPLDAEEFSNYQNAEDKARQLCGYLVEHLTAPQPIDAMLLASDGLVRITQMALQLFNLQPGKDVLLAGYDNFWAEIQDTPYDPSVPQVTVDKDNWNIGQALVELLIDRVEGRLPDVPQQRSIAPQLVITPNATGSTG